MNNYVSQIVKALRQIDGNLDHDVTDTVEFFISTNSDQLEVVVRLTNPPGLNDLLLSLYYSRSADNLEEVVLCVRDGEQDVPQHPSFQESGESDLERYLERQLLVVRLSL
ncbi:hypothetical protein DUZ99_01840 [Xylanibacillus composti]|nr:hypothetical protein [Xylanibacillus composti]